MQYIQVFNHLVNKKWLLGRLNPKSYRKIFKCWMTSAANSTPKVMPGTTQKGFLLYHNLKFDIWTPRLFSLFGVFACGMSLYVSYDLRQLSLEKEPEVSDIPASFSDQLYQGAFGKLAPYIYVSTGTFIFFVTRRFCNASVKKLLLSTDRQNVTFVSYRLFGKDRIRTFPVSDITFRKSKIKIRNYSSHYTIMKSGTVTNKSLLEWTLNSYTGPAESENEKD